MTARILIVGGGAVGTLVGGKLAAAGNAVVLLNHNKEYCDAVNRGGCTILEKGLTIHAKPLAVLDPPEAFGGERRFDLVLFSVKGFSTASLADMLLPYDARIARIVTLQNGLGNEEILASRFPLEKITAASFTIACSMETPGTAEAENSGGIALASLDGKRVPDGMARLFAESGFRVKRCADWRGMKWSKLLLNIIANATCAILDMSPTEILSSRAAFRIEHAACLEAITVMEACGIRPVSLPSQPVPLYVWGIKHLPERILQIAFRKRAARGRGKKPASLHIDILKGKNRTEASFLYGAIVEKAEEKKIKVPVLKTLNLLIEKGAGDPAFLATLRMNPEGLLARIRNAAG